MKNVMILFFLGLFIMVADSCKDKGFEPSLDLEEYVLMNVNGIERLFTADNYIDVSKITNNDGVESIHISLNPEPQTFTHFFLEIVEPSLGSFSSEEVNINYLDYSLSDGFPMIQLNCTSFECEGEINVTIHELGGLGEKMIGELSGTLTLNDGTSNQFSGEFVVFRDQ